MIVQIDSTFPRKQMSKECYNNVRSLDYFDESRLLILPSTVPSLALFVEHLREGCYSRALLCSHLSVCDCFRAIALWLLREAIIEYCRFLPSFSTSSFKTSVDVSVSTVG